ncbi:hypothetical protein SAMN02745181_1267 [Rubritalea squalenifaciens DSM 18772]|uniref:Uncharacterized protein n=1 Tax=Rubritalea squalenifaciens DSM 18772 TaxID=1123071 RepID=A0A1M6GU33_9BACT|nr:hypothetical protein [Rubritalea squalenifaciens]SHJ13432.1 hypothetical protein SAMN02745181_1267 [Rubritalea squalenifaciens DSM 18772]
MTADPKPLGHKKFIKAIQGKQAIVDLKESDAYHILKHDSRIIGREAVELLDKQHDLVSLLAGFGFLAVLGSFPLGVIIGFIETTSSIIWGVLALVLGTIVVHLIQAKIKASAHHIAYNLVVKSMIADKQLYKYLVARGVHIDRL